MELITSDGHLKADLEQKFSCEQQFRKKRGYGPNIKEKEKLEFEKYFESYMTTTSRHISLMRESYQRKIKREKSREKRSREFQERQITASLDKKTLHSNYINSHRLKKPTNPLKPSSLPNNQKPSIIVDSHAKNSKDQSSFLKLADLLESPHKRGISSDFNISKNDKSGAVELLKVIEESIHEEVVKDKEDEKNSRVVEEQEKSRNFLPSIANISAISHRENDKPHLPKPNEIYELNRKENLLQNELKLLNREKQDYVKNVEKKNRIKLVMVKSDDILKKNYQNLFDDPLKIEVIDEEDLENSLDNIDYVLGKKGKPKKGKEGPHLYIFPHVKTNNTSKNQGINTANVSHSVFFNPNNQSNLSTNQKDSNVSRLGNNFLKQADISRSSHFANNYQNEPLMPANKTSVLSNLSNDQATPIGNPIMNQPPAINPVQQSQPSNPTNTSRQSSPHAHKTDLLLNKASCQIIQEENSTQTDPSQQNPKPQDSQTSDFLGKGYQEIGFHRKNLKKMVESEHEKVRKQLEFMRKIKKKGGKGKETQNPTEIPKNEEIHEGTINIVNKENFKKILIS